MRRRNAGQEDDLVLLTVDQSDLSAAVLEVTERREGKGGRRIWVCWWVK